MNFNYFDAHSHLNFDQFDNDRDEVIDEMNTKRIGTITVGVDLKTSKESVELADKHDHIWATVGVHPTDANDGFDEERFAQLLGERVVAVGECGFDYFHDDTTKEVQQRVFEQQITFALEHDLPLMLHCRPRKGTQDAYEDTLDILEEVARKQSNLRGNVHFFVGDVEIARRFLALGFSLSFTGVVTFAHVFDEVVRFTPPDMIITETDAPFAAPEPYRGKRNSPLYVQEVVMSIADIRDEDVNVVQHRVVENAARIFNI